jgi:N-acyl-phosphatidylethanolamine-hydrolysing phospholipase D
MKLIVTFLCLTLSLIVGCSTPQFNEEEWQKRVNEVSREQLYAKHEKDGVFFVPWLDFEKKVSDILTWKLSGTLKYSEEEEVYLPKIIPDAAGTLSENIRKDFILWIGHDSFLIKTGEEVWLLDPMFSKRALLPPRKTPPALTPREINELFPRVNVVISHNHYDHLDQDSIEALSKEYVYYVPLGLEKTLRDWQPDAKIIEMDWWQERKLAEGYEIHCLPAQHWSRRALDGVNTSLWASYMIITPDTTLYFGGDSGYFIGYREIGEKYPKIDYALIPTTAYHPRWFMHTTHMNIEEAIQAFHELGASYFIPTQWGTFHLGDEPPGYPALDLQRIIQSRELDQERFLIMDIGQLIVIP